MMLNELHAFPWGKRKQESQGFIQQPEEGSVAAGFTQDVADPATTSLH